MATSDLERIERFNKCWDEVVCGTAITAASADAADVAAVRAFHSLDDAPAPAPAIRERLRQELLSNDDPRPVPIERRPTRTLRRRWPFAGLVAMALALVIAGLSPVVRQPESVSAEDIVRRAQGAVVAPVGVQSFASVERQTSRSGNARMNAYSGYTGSEEIRNETKRWYETPDRWRIEATGTVIDAAGAELPERGWSYTVVTDGTTRWHYDARSNAVSVSNAADFTSGKGGTPGQLSLGQSLVDVRAALELSNPNVRPKLSGEDTVAGRRAYVLSFPATVQSASAPELNGPRTVWVDKQTYFVLKVLQYSGIDGALLSTHEVTSIQYDPALDAALFTFTPPADAEVDDQRPKPAPTVDEFTQQMSTLAAQADFPLYLPKQAPDGLVPRQPYFDAQNGLMLEYAPSAEAGADAFATMRITEQRATYDLVQRWTERTETVRIGNADGWLRRGTRNVDGTGSDSAALVLRDGTLISVTSFTVSADELAKVAASLAAVPGGHAPLPNPTAPSLEEVRAKASFTLFLPSYVPAGLAPEPPIPGQQAGSGRVDAVTMVFHGLDGEDALRLTEGPPRDPSSMARPMLAAPEVTIKDGLAGRLMSDPSTRTNLLWWEQSGTFIALETRVLPKEELLRMAASMSTTASLGPFEPRAPRPTPTPLPAPTFTVLRPTWLPEPMTVREQIEPDPTGTGSAVVLGFDPHPSDQPHSVLLLREMRQSALPDAGGTPDPETTYETIDGREVTIIQRGENWITMTWVQDGLALTLENPYDPPGHPRYTPDQLRQVMASIR